MAATKGVTNVYYLLKIINSVKNYKNATGSGRHERFPICFSLVKTSPRLKMYCCHCVCIAYARAVCNSYVSCYKLDIITVKILYNTDRFGVLLIEVCCF